MKFFKILLLFICFSNSYAFEQLMDCGGVFKIEREFMLSDKSKYSHFTNVGTCTDNLGLYSSYSCFGKFETKNDIIIETDFLCENIYGDGEKSWSRGERKINTEIDSSLGKLTFIDGTGKYKVLIGSVCNYGIKFINHDDYSSSFSKNKCELSNKQYQTLIEK